MKSAMSNETFVLLGGALLGAGALYFLDPHSGARRRQRIVSAAEDALGQAGSSARSVASHVAGHAGDVHHEAAKYAQNLADQAQEVASDLAARAARSMPHDPTASILATGHRWFDRARQSASHLSDVGGHLWNRARGMMNAAPEMAADHAHAVQTALAERADGWRRQAAGHVSRASHATQAWLGHEESEGFGTGTLVSSTAGCLAVGAGLMYFLDPKQGRGRRAWALDKMTSCVHRTGRTMRGVGTDIANRLHGAAHGAQSRARALLDRGRLDSDELVRNIRAEISRALPRATQVQLMADADGTITITGSAAREDVDGLLALLHKMPGVEHVINRLTMNQGGAENRGAPMPAGR